MGEESARTELSEAEAAYYRAVEDAFARLRGTPFFFSPKDWALLEKWWREGVSLAAILAGLAEVFGRRQNREEDPVSSLSFCRHAVARHWRRLNAGSIGGEQQVSVDVSAALQRCVRELLAVAQRWEQHPALADGILALAASVATLPESAPPAAVDQALTQLEKEALQRLARLVPSERRREVEQRVEQSLEGMTGDPRVVERTRRALLLREWRCELGLPRLELNPE